MFQLKGEGLTKGGYQNNDINVIFFTKVEKITKCYDRAYEIKEATLR